ncbi:hypothetical protein RRF57_006244 [Xylaria bambusicola]|uniref:Uncharacterized protein n=1 Tax=Xylaria bambusicola TaxID=326684 RepID=A0AAN7UZ39_9PEZI
MNGKLKLAKLAHGEPEDRNTVASEMSAKTTTSHTDLQMQDDYAQQIDLTREPQVEIDDENMTSALFIDDITMDSNKKFAQKKKSKHAHTVRVMSPVLSDTEPSIHMEQKTAEKSKGRLPPRYSHHPPSTS